MPSWSILFIIVKNEGLLARAELAAGKKRLTFVPVLPGK
jgi:hypothetical protein